MNKMDIQKEWDLFVAHLRTLGVVKIGRNALGIITNLTREGKCSLSYNDIELMWETWQAAKAQAVSEGRTDFEIINQTIELVDLLALSTNVFQRDPKSKVHPFESENPRVMEWWRTACQIQELLTNTDPDNCDFEEYKAMIEAQENKG